MTDEQKFWNGLHELAKFHKMELSLWNLEAYALAFTQLGFDRGIEALKVAFMKAGGNSAMPSADKLLEFIGIAPKEAPKSRDRGIEAASTILEAIAKFGGYKAIQAKEYLGEDLWEVVRGMGGWEELCMTNLDEIGTLRAQIRDLAEAKLKIKSAGGDNSFLLDSGPRSKEIRNIIGELLDL